MTRNAMLNLDASDENGRRAAGSGSELDCARFERWPAANMACSKLTDGSAPAAKRDEWALMLLSPTLQREQQFHFMQARTSAGSSVPRRCRPGGKVVVKGTESEKEMDAGCREEGQRRRSLRWGWRGEEGRKGWAGPAEGWGE